MYSTADADSLHVRMADHAVCIGPPSAAASYLRIPNIVAAAETTGCEAVHPGYGFLAENPAFVEACVDNDLVFVGPPADVMATMGDKIAAKVAMLAAEVPIVPGRRRRRDAGAGARAAASWGIRSCSKASAGGGGKGCGWCSAPRSSRMPTARPRRRRRRRSAIRRSTSRRRSSRRATSRSRCSATHFGNVLTLGERECSIQRRHQKLIEESPSVALTPEARERDGVGGRAGVPRRRLPQRRHVRVPARRRTAASTSSS